MHDTLSNDSKQTTSNEMTKMTLNDISWNISVKLYSRNLEKTNKLNPSD